MLLSVSDQVCAHEPTFGTCGMPWADCMLVKTTDSVVSTVKFDHIPNILCKHTQSADYTPRVAAVVSLYSQLRKALPMMHKTFLAHVNIFLRN